MPALSTGHTPSILTQTQPLLTQTQPLTQTSAQPSSTPPHGSKRVVASIAGMSAYESASLALQQEQVAILRNLSQLFGARPSAVSQALQTLKLDALQQGDNDDDEDDEEQVSIDTIVVHTLEASVCVSC